MFHYSFFFVLAIFRSNLWLIWNNSEFLTELQWYYVLLKFKSLVIAEIMVRCVILSNSPSIQICTYFARMFIGQRWTWIGLMFKCDGNLVALIGCLTLKW
jgi:hypothetical protein